MMRADLLIEFLVSHFFNSYFSPHLGHNASLSLFYRSHVDTWWVVWVKPESIILTCNVGETYYPLSLRFPLGCLYLIQRWDILGHHYDIGRWTDENFPWLYTPSFLPQDYHWFSCPDFFHINRRNTSLCRTSNIIRFLSVWMFITCKTRLVVCVNIRWGEGWGC